MVDSMGERLQKVLAHAGVASRRAAEALISAGRVAVDGVVVTELGTRVNAARQTITVDGQPLGATGPIQVGERVTYLLNKPVGVLSTSDDPQRRPTVVALVPGTPRVYPVGRLDADSEGLLLLSNDGDLTYRLTHPRYGVDKEYEALVRGYVTQETLRRLQTGVVLDDSPRPTAAAVVEQIARVGEDTLLRFVIHEGRNRQIRRMMQAVGGGVLSLRRVRFGPLALGALAPGHWRLLTAAEVAALDAATGTEPTTSPPTPLLKGEGSETTPPVTARWQRDEREPPTPAPSRWQRAGGPPSPPARKPVSSRPPAGSGRGPSGPGRSPRPARPSPPAAGPPRPLSARPARPPHAGPPTGSPATPPRFQPAPGRLPQGGPRRSESDADRPAGPPRPSSAPPPHARPARPAQERAAHFSPRPERPSGPPSHPPQEGPPRFQPAPGRLPQGGPLRSESGVDRPPHAGPPHAGPPRPSHGRPSRPSQERPAHFGQRPDRPSGPPSRPPQGGPPRFQPTPGRLPQRGPLRSESGADQPARPPRPPQSGPPRPAQGGPSRAPGRPAYPGPPRRTPQGGPPRPPRSAQPSDHATRSTPNHDRPAPPRRPGSGRPTDRPPRRPTRKPGADHRT